LFSTLHDFCEMAFKWSADKLPAPGISRSMMYFGMAGSFQVGLVVVAALFEIWPLSPGP
jgi:hypothetical protein